ncbi:MAG: homoserine dehydrogenase [Ruthenibacterium sp.]
MAKIAIIGFGTVGSGVLEVLRRNSDGIARRAGQPVSVKYICDIRDFRGHPDAALFVNNIDIILNDPEVRVVVETIGGLKPAYLYVRQSLESGRHVVTSNKELVATHGAELLHLARAHGVCFLFEASVGGGTPVITPIHQCLAANVVSEIMGIVNGTTNFMLTKMARDAMTFDEALKTAQSLGYAETIDPSADVDGIDAQRKIAILASLAFGSQVYPQNVPTRGIRDVTVHDIAMAAKLNCAVRLIAWAKHTETGVLSCGVEPCLVPRTNQLAGVEDVFNAVLVKGDMLGDVVFYGKGAGKLPTASAVVADVIDALKNGTSIHDSLFWRESLPMEGTYRDSGEYDFYVRVSRASAATVQTAFDALGTLEVLDGADGLDGDVAFLVRSVTGDALLDCCGKARAAGLVVQNTLKRLPE